MQTPDFYGFLRNKQKDMILRVHGFRSQVPVVFCDVGLYINHG